MKYKDLDSEMRVKLNAELGKIRDIRIENARSELAEFRKTSIFLNAGGIVFSFPVLQYFDFSGLAWLALLAGFFFLAGLLIAAINTWSSATRYATISRGFSDIGNRMYADQIEVEDVQDELDRVSRKSKPRIRDWQFWIPMATAFAGAACIAIALFVHYLFRLCG